MTTALSILIPTTPDREKDVERLLLVIGEQVGLSTSTKFKLEALEDGQTKTCIGQRYSCQLPVEVIVFTDNKEMTLGLKRELLYFLAKGDYSWQIDSDDSIDQDAIPAILNIIESGNDVDCITFQEKCLMNGEYKTSDHSIHYPEWKDNSNGFDFVRSVFYKDVIKTSIAQSVPFPKCRYNEDELWAKAIKPYLKTEWHINSEIYHYIYEPKGESHEQRYGLAG